MLKLVVNKLNLDHLKKLVYSDCDLKMPRLVYNHEIKDENLIIFRNKFNTIVKKQITKLEKQKHFFYF